MSEEDFTQKGQLIETFLESVADKLGRSSGFVKRQSKLTGKVFVQTLLLGWLANAKAGLSELSYWAGQLGVKVSPQGLGKRFQAESVAYLAALFAESLARFRSEACLPSALLGQFKGVYLLDSTQVSLPAGLQAHWAGSGGAASPAAVKVHLSLDYLSGSLAGIEVSAGKCADTQSTLALHTAEAESLHVFDLGYFKLALFEQLAKAQAYFISRLRPHTGLFDSPETPLALDSESRCQQFAGQQHELTLYLGETTRLPVRVLWQRCPPAVAEERRRKARANARKKKRTPSAKHLAAQDWQVFITNVPPERLDFEAVLSLYRLRWQIELLFKLCKSHLALDVVGACGEHRILTQLYARLILLVLLCGLSTPYRWTATGELSLTKAFHLLTCYAHPLLACIQQAWQPIVPLLAQLSDDFLRLAQKSSRKKSPSSLQALFAREA